MTESYFPAISMFETRAADARAIGAVPTAEPREDSVRLTVNPGGVSVRGRYWREGPYFKAVVHVQAAGAEPKTISVDVDLRPIVRALHRYYRDKRGVQISGFPGSFFKAVKKIGRSQLLKSVGAAVKSVVKSKVVGAAVGAAAVVFPPVGIPAAAAYATANTALELLDHANEIKQNAKRVLMYGTAAEKALLHSKGAELTKVLTRARNLRMRLQDIAVRAARGSLPARKTASIFKYVMDHRNRVQSLVGKAKAAEAWTQGLLVTSRGKIVPGNWLLNQAEHAMPLLAPPKPPALPSAVTSAERSITRWLGDYE
jgi:hypothetical protein